MSRTIGRHVPPNLPRGDYPATCDYCGVLWYRSQLRLDGSGLYYCPDEGDGPDRTTQLQRNREGAERYRDEQREISEQVFDGSPFTFEPVEEDPGTFPPDHL